MIALVCGGRDFDDYLYLCRRMNYFHEQLGITEVLHGAAKGADMCAANWATARGIPTRAFPADWQGLGKAAGPIRNRQMVAQQPDCVIAFKGGRGTHDLINQARVAGIIVHNHDDQLSHRSSPPSSSE